MSKSETEHPLVSPLAFVPCSNGEYAPKEASTIDRRAEEHFRNLVEVGHKKTGLSRRAFAESACGMAAALLTINQIYGCTPGEPGEVGKDLAGYDLSPDLLFDQGRACAALSGNEFIFDVQVHPASPLSPWRDPPIPMTAQDLLRMIFVASDTTVACISGVYFARDEKDNIQANRQLVEMIDKVAGPRLLAHVNVDPTRGASELDYMSMAAASGKVAAWKVYPHIGPWRLDRGAGPGFLEKCRAVGVKIIAAHRGIGPGIDYAADSSPVDLVQAAKMFPDLTFLTYHSAWDTQANEDHPFDPAQANPVGVDRLIKGVLDNKIGKNGNVYAELGSTWRGIMTSPNQAAHVLGKLLVHLGEDRIVWGTDTVFTGSAQEQIAAFRVFQIPQVMRERYGYPEITPAIRQKILGLNAAKVYGVDPAAMRCILREDMLSGLRAEYRADPRSMDVPRHKDLGPRTRREFLAYLNWTARGV